MIVELRETDAVKSTKAASTINAQDSNIASLELNFQDIVKKIDSSQRKKFPPIFSISCFQIYMKPKFTTIFNMLSQPKLDI
jgi:hypothetical protein